MGSDISKRRIEKLLQYDPDGFVISNPVEFAKILYKNYVKYIS
jgi:hypothetical protein